MQFGRREKDKNVHKNFLIIQNVKWTYLTPFQKNSQDWEELQLGREKIATWMSRPV